ncbi:dihydroorotate dehydrogenase (quinone) [Niveispirillum lacus]|uniref:Dihydroorotate dehydrogenase (quinone) n=1 Tax=Niveispirillum lacus TaxID=1981099 RepID=A0A255YUJ6_9PROT|nr:quinone-dependent dihydroorotate dehydrogenase [Niveispirillum lacus]OYQ32325.1 dihydroorotate dehydrogenase (quinone) [Niveispirillum lacus]
MVDLYPLARPFLMAMDAEQAHNLTIAALKTGLVPGGSRRDPASLSTRVFGLDFANPIGLAAGFDKNAEVPDAMLKLGFGFVECGTVTPRPQDGNPKPRLFRVPTAQAVINRFGFNNQGLEVYAERLQARSGRSGIVGANVGKNKETADAASDYTACIRRVAPLASYLVVNVSSPNTPGLRTLQSRDALADLLGQCLAARAETGAKPPLLLKVAPDLTDEDKADIAAVVLNSGIDGLIVSNTTLARPAAIPSALAAEAGGLSGRPLLEPSTKVLGEFYQLLGGRLPLIGVGGVSSGADAYAKIRAGASLVQLYSALAYQGPGLVGRIKAELAMRLADDGYAHVADAVGAAHRKG